VKCATFFQQCADDGSHDFDGDASRRFRLRNEFAVALHCIALVVQRGGELAEGAFADYTRAAWHKRISVRWRMRNGGDHEPAN